MILQMKQKTKSHAARESKYCAARKVIYILIVLAELMK